MNVLPEIPPQIETNDTQPKECWYESKIYDIAQRSAQYCLHIRISIQFDPAKCDVSNN